MVSDDRIRKLLGLGSESRNLDYKGPFSWATADKDLKHGIVKDVLSFANSRDGGVLLIGVDDQTGHHIGLSDEQAASFDQTRFNDFVQVYTEPKHTSHVHRRVLDSKNIVVIEVPEFADMPIICKQTAGSVTDPKRILLRKGALYKRTDRASSEVIEDADDMRELINRALLRRQDELLAAISQIMNPKRPGQAASNFASYEPEIQEVDEYITKHLGPILAKVGHWTVTFRPTSYLLDRVPELRNLRALLHETQVSLSGIKFPTFSDNDSNFTHGFQSWCDSEVVLSRLVEAFRAYKSGLFRWKGALWEEFYDKYAGRRLISWAGIAYQITECFLFAQRYYERILSATEQLHVEFVLHDSQGRSLVSLPNEMPLYGNHVSREDQVVLQDTVDIAELRANSLGIGLRFIRRVYEIFNWDTVNETLITGLQQQFLSGRA